MPSCARKFVKGRSNQNEKNTNCSHNGDVLSNGVHIFTRTRCRDTPTRALLRAEGAVNSTIEVYRKRG